MKQYEKFSRYLRNELCSNNLKDFGLKKGLDNLEAVREKFQAITSRFASFQAQWLNVHVDFPLLQRIALPITIGSVRYPGIKIHETRIIRLMEVLLHGAVTLVVGRPRRSTKLSSPPSAFQRKGIVSTNCATICASSRVMRYWSATAPATPTASPPKAWRSRCSFSSFTNGCVDPLPTAASIINPMPNTAQTAASKPPIIAPTRPSNQSLICSPPLDNC